MEYVSESLLASIDKVDTRDIDLCDPRWRVAPQGWFSDEEELEPEKKKLKQTLDRGRFHRITEKELDSLVVAKPPVNTEYSTKWAVRNFNDWKHQRNATCSSESKAIPDDLLESSSVNQLCHWLSLYVLETRNKQGQPYPPKTLYQLLTGLHRHALIINPHTPNFLDKNNRAFGKLHNVIDNHFKALRKEGIGSDSKHTEVITKEEENKLWESGILGLVTSPKALLRAVFFYNGKNFFLRGGAEHRYLKLSQFTRCSEPNHHYIYVENSSKNRQGGFAQLRIENKVVPIFANSSAGDRCHVHILDTYISKLPEEVKQKDFFYACPLPAILVDSKKPWFAPVPIGKNSLNTMLKDMCHEAGITGRKTNHSLRATGASELFAAGVPEKIIKDRTGHRSLDALHVYEHTTSTQHQAVSTILGSRNKISLQEALFTPFVPSSSKSTPANNIFNNCSVQVIQTTHPIQLPPLPPPPLSSAPPQSKLSPPHAQHTPGALDVKRDIDIQQYLDLVDFNMEELLNF